MDWILVQLMWNCFQEHAIEPYWLLVNIESGNGLVPSGNKPLPEPMLTLCHWIHYSDMTLGTWCLKSLGTQLLVQANSLNSSSALMAHCEVNIVVTAGFPWQSKGPAIMVPYHGIMHSVVMPGSYKNRSIKLLNYMLSQTCFIHIVLYESLHVCDMYYFFFH